MGGSCVGVMMHCTVLATYWVLFSSHREHHGCHHLSHSHRWPVLGLWQKSTFLQYIDMQSVSKYSYKHLLLTHTHKKKDQWVFPQANIYTAPPKLMLVVCKHSSTSPLSSVLTHAAFTRVQILERFRFPKSWHSDVHSLWSATQPRGAVVDEPKMPKHTHWLWWSRGDVTNRESCCESVLLWIKVSTNKRAANTSWMGHSNLISIFFPCAPFT